MKVTIIPADRVVGIDGDWEQFDYSIAENIHAVQWDSDAEAGHVEYNDGTPNEKIDDFSAFADLIPAHAQAKLNNAAAREAARQQAIEAMDYRQRRRMEYPSVEDQLEALHDARNGDSSKLAAIDAQIVSIKARYPKEA